MSLAKQYDNWLHVHMMNPFFGWIQKLFHWNRFQLIHWFSWVQVVGFAVITLLLCVELVRIKIWTDALWVFVYTRSWFTGYQWMKIFGPELKKASQAYEAEKPVYLTPALVFYAHDRRHIRPAFAVIVTFFLICLVLLLAHGVTRMLPQYVITTLTVVVWAECHLWDIDDVQPKDRSFLLESKSQEA